MFQVGALLAFVVQVKESIVPARTYLYIPQECHLAAEEVLHQFGIACQCKGICLDGAI